jgi:hypothetical protein
MLLTVPVPKARLVNPGLGNESDMVGLEQNPKEVLAVIINGARCVPPAPLTQFRADE